MSFPPDSVFLPEPTDSPEDPFGLFPSEIQKPAEIQKPPEVQRAAAERQNAVPVPPNRAGATGVAPCDWVALAAVRRPYRGIAPGGAVRCRCMRVDGVGGSPFASSQVAPFGLAAGHVAASHIGRFV